MDYHALAQIVKHAQVRVDQLIVELYLLFSQLVVVGVYLVYELPVEINQLFEFLLQQASHALLLALFDLLLPFPLHTTSKVSVNGVVRIDLKNTVWLFPAKAAIFAPANFLDVGTSPRITFLQSIKNIILVDESEAVKAEFLFAGSCLVRPIALVHKFSFKFAHVACSNFDERNGGAFVKRELLDVSLSIVGLFHH